MTTMLERPVEGEKVEHRLSILDRNGDTEFKWDPAVPAEVEAARAQFDTLKKKGYLAYNTGSNEVVRDFDPQARELVMRPQTVGG